MIDLAVAFGLVDNQLGLLGRALVERAGLLNIWTAALLAAALVLDRALSRRARASLRIALYAPVGLRILIPLDWGIRLATVPDATTIVAPLLRIEAPDSPPSPQAPSWYALAALVYFAVATLLATRALLARTRLRRALANASPVVGVYAHLPFPVLQHAEIGPLVFGLFTPRIIVPRPLLLPEASHALECVLRHEIAHLRRHDAWLSAAMQLLVITAWPVLPAWMAMVRVRRLMELACDEAALASANATERRRYGHALLDMAERISTITTPLGAGELHFGSTLRTRIEAIAAQRHWPLALQVPALLFASLLLLMACAAKAPPPASPPTKQPYGYEFATDTADTVAASDPSTDALPAGPGGRLFPESIQTVVRSHFGQVLSCYHQGRRKDPQLEGKVIVKFVIAEDGTTKEAVDHGSTLPDEQVVQCVVDAFRQRKYRASTGGEVTVVYPIQFSP